jgi:uncharacterized RDD family membrane protein YckC
MTYAGIWRRLAAVLIDIVPIALFTAAFFYVFLEFEFGLVRNVSYVIWIVYSTVFEASPSQATFGKRLLEIKVVGDSGQRLGWLGAISRNLAKILSILPLGLGFVWLLFSKNEQAWHDMIARTYVTRT